MRLILCSLILLTLGALAGCTLISGKPRQISAEDFRRTITGINSASSSEFIGATGQRAYLENTNLVALPSLLGFGPTVTVSWVNLDELTAEERESLKQGKSPWGNFVAGITKSRDADAKK